MGYIATVVKVMIASPGDVEHERDIIRDALHEWNAVNSEHEKLVLLPLGWETHSSPQMGARAQEVINNQVLDGADLLIAAFWTRLGTPTGVSASGTVEEVERHVEKKKSTMIYFSNRPISPEDIDENQRRELKKFKESCKRGGLIEDGYKSLSEFKDKFRRQLAQTVQREFVDGRTQEIKSNLEGDRDLTDVAKKLLVAASKDKHGSILKLSMMGGSVVQAGRTVMNKQGDARSEAQWSAALNELIDARFAEEVGHKGEVFKLTYLGWQYAEKHAQT